MRTQEKEGGGGEEEDCSNEAWTEEGRAILAASLLSRIKSLERAGMVGEDEDEDDDDAADINDDDKAWTRAMVVGDDITEDEHEVVDDDDDDEVADATLASPYAMLFLALLLLLFVCGQLPRR